MSEINLTSVEKAELEARHRASKNVGERDRIRAVLLRSEGWRLPEIAQALRIHENTVARHLKDYTSRKKMTGESGGSQSFLSDKQTQVLVKHLTENLHHNTREIISYIAKRWGIYYSVPGLNKWLHKNGFSYKKSKGRPYKADPEQQEKFVQAYETLKNELGNEEEILFIDAVHPTQATKLSYGWIRTGQTKEIATSASRTRMNLIGAIELKHPEKTTVQAYERINAKTTADFLTALRKRYSDKARLHIILDRAGYHRSKFLKSKAEELNITLHYLPPYSPNLNPIERLWKIMNEQVRNNRFFKSAKDFKKAILGFFKKKLPKMKAALHARINDNFQTMTPQL